MVALGSPRRFEFHSLLKPELEVMEVMCARSPLRDVPPKGILSGSFYLPSALQGNEEMS